MKIDPPKRQFVYVSYINTAPKKLWAALKGPKFIRRYRGGCRLESDGKVESAVKHFSPERTFNWQGPILRREIFRVLSYAFMHQESKGRALVIQEWEAVLGNLKTLLETGETLLLTWKG